MNGVEDDPFHRPCAWLQPRLEATRLQELYTRLYIEIFCEHSTGYTLKRVASG